MWAFLSITTILPNELQMVYGCSSLYFSVKLCQCYVNMIASSHKVFLWCHGLKLQDLIRIMVSLLFLHIAVNAQNFVPSFTMIPLTLLAQPPPTLWYKFWVFSAILLRRLNLLLLGQFSLRVSRLLEHHAGYKQTIPSLFLATTQRWKMFPAIAVFSSLTAHTAVSEVFCC